MADQEQPPVPAGERREAIGQELNRVLNALALELPPEVHAAAGLRIKRLFLEALALPAARPEPPAAEPKYMEISKHELRQRGSAPFLWHCFERFRAGHPAGFFGDNLVLMWRKDYEKLTARAAVHAQEGPRDE